MEIQSLYSFLNYSIYLMFMLTSITFAMINTYIYSKGEQTNIRLWPIIGNICITIFLINTLTSTNPFKDFLIQDNFTFALYTLILAITIYGNIGMIEGCTEVNKETYELSYATA